jgi:hypothetical protein
MLRMRLRIRILGSVPLTNESGCGPGGQKTHGSGTLVHLHHSLKIKIHTEVTSSINQGFITIFDK